MSWSPVGSSDKIPWGDKGQDSCCLPSSTKTRSAHRIHRSTSFLTGVLIVPGRRTDHQGLQQTAYNRSVESVRGVEGSESQERTFPSFTIVNKVRQSTPRAQSRILRESLTACGSSTNCSTSTHNKPYKKLFTTRPGRSDPRRDLDSRPGLNLRPLRERWLAGGCHSRVVVEAGLVEFPHNDDRGGRPHGTLRRV